MRIPFLDLKAQYESIKEEIDIAVMRVIDSQKFILGEEVSKLEQDICKYTGAKAAIGVASGTDALLVSLRTLSVGRDDEVITTPYTFFATAGAIYNAGATPVFCDIDTKTYNIDPSKIEKRITNKTKAIIVVHLYGQTADMEAIIQVADKYNLPIIEDTAQALGASYKGKKAGTISALGAVSFFPSKNLGGMGDGGMILTNNELLAKKARMLRVHGAEKKYYHSMIGYNSRLDTIQAAILAVKLKYLDQWNNTRRQAAKYYNKLLAGVPGVKTPYVDGDNYHIYHQYVIELPSQHIRDRLINFLIENNISCGVYYPVPLHLQKCFTMLGYKEGDMPISEQASKVTLSLPIYPEITNEQQHYVIEVIQRFKF